MTEYQTNFFGASIGTDEIENGSITADKISATALNAVASPIGSIVAWLKSYTNTPALPSGWVECNGQVLSDAGSVYNGQTIPDLNSTQYFLRGSSTSGTTGGTATHSHITVYPAGNSDRAITLTTASANDSGGYDSAGNFRAFSGSYIDVNGTPFYTSKTSTLPPYYEVVWIMRIK